MDGLIGAAATYDTDGNGNIDYFYIVFDESKVNPGKTNWYWPDGPAEGNYDFLGLFMHEFGHGLGSDCGDGQQFNCDSGHFNESGSACPDTSNRSTMCDFKNGFLNDATRPGTWSRTLGTHDIGIVDEVYPAPLSRHMKKWIVLAIGGAIIVALLVVALLVLVPGPPNCCVGDLRESIAP